MISHPSTPAAAISGEQASYLIAMAARAPSVHNSQPWRFAVGDDAIDLYADPGRKLQADPLGREMLISCGAALFGLRLAVRSLGYQPRVSLLPDPDDLRLLATIRLGAPQPMTSLESQMVDAIPHRHTHRGPFAAEPLPSWMVPALQHDALSEKAKLVPIGRSIDYERLSDIFATVSPRQDSRPQAQADSRRWTRQPASTARDGVPAQAFAAEPGGSTGRLRQRDFDGGRRIGLLDTAGPPPAVTAVLLTLRDRRADWLNAGQALQRLLLHAASQWVFASIYTQPLEARAIRDLIRDRLALPGAPQVLLQFGIVRDAHPTARRPPTELTATAETFPCLVTGPR